jgi:hypothetical protein
MRLGLVVVIWLGMSAAAIAADQQPRITTTKDGKVLVDGKPAHCKVFPPMVARKGAPKEARCVIAFQGVDRYPDPKSGPH